MRCFAVVNATDTQVGLRLAGIESVVAHEKNEVADAIDRAVSDPGIGVLLIAEKLTPLCPERIYELKLKRRTPVVVEIPDRHGTGRAPDSITRYVREAIGIKL
jgi:V/A-type H+-transporting ATPase subunit F